MRFVNIHETKAHLSKLRTMDTANFLCHAITPSLFAISHPFTASISTASWLPKQSSKDWHWLQQIQSWCVIPVRYSKS